MSLRIDKRANAPLFRIVTSTPPEMWGLIALWTRSDPLETDRKKKVTLREMCQLTSFFLVCNYGTAL